MNWSNVKLIFLREVRDQLRDRRTLFMIAVLPLLLYPLLGTSFFQLSQFSREQSTKVLLVGAPQIIGLPPLVRGGRFATELFNGDADRAELLELQLADSWPTGADSSDPVAQVREAIQQGQFDVLVYFPPDFSQKLALFRASLLEPRPRGASQAPNVPSPTIYPNTTKDKSQIALFRTNEVLDHWREAIGRQALQDSNVPLAAARPFNVTTIDVAEATTRKTALWSKVLPFVLLLWALTGAFYPAVDLCAGEKERGTLETLLSSPAERSEIVWGKLLTIMLFSMATAILNLLSMGITGSFVMSHMPNFGPPPPMAIVWLLCALVPMSAMFSALCLALAAFARSTKEGHYYLMPLVLVTLPLTILPMAPGVELTLGNSLIPVTGVILLLRTLLEGGYAEALPYVPVVAAVTLTCCLLAMRWAADQFNKESVLFRESERLDVGLWFKQLRRDREDTPSATQAVFCGVLILMIQFFMSFAVPPGQSLVVLAIISQLTVVVTPALLMTIMLTRSPRKTLLLRMPSWGAIPAAVLLAVALHPLIRLLGEAVMRAYPVSHTMAKELNRLVGEVDSLWVLLLVGAVPAVCEELAFRGFILSGLRHLGHRWRAIVLSSIFFGVTHAILQQSLIACLVGMLLGFLAVQTGSLLPGILFHLTHNSLTMLSSKVTPEVIQQFPLLRWLFHASGSAKVEQLDYGWPVVAVGTLVSAAILIWLQRMPYARSAEESLQEAIEHVAPHGPEVIARARAGIGMAQESHDPDTEDVETASVAGRG